MIEGLCTIAGALLIIAVSLLLIFTFSIWLLALWNGHGENEAREELNAELHVLDRWLAQYPQAVLVIEYLRRFNKTRYHNAYELRENLRALVEKT